MMWFTWIMDFTFPGFILLFASQKMIKIYINVAHKCQITELYCIFYNVSYMYSDLDRLGIDNQCQQCVY